MKRLFSNRAVLAVCLLLALLFVIRLPASRLRSRVLGSISAAVGRNVEAGSLHVRFLPRPGFDIDDLVVHDDSAFGAEPLLRAPEVTASLQLKALLRGRIEIATLSLSDASVNLARNAAGEWNLVDLLQRTSKSTVAPTASHRASRQFPYIEGTRARINFKTGAEKTHFAFTDAKFSLWQDSDNAWGMRLRARPIRTDANLTDTGILNVSGNWQRSAVLHETPLDFSFEWAQAQIGQVSNLIYNSDKGWRGNGTLSGVIQGTPEHLKVSLDGSVEDFRRHDVLGVINLRMLAHCTADSNLLERTLKGIDCIAPTGVGTVQLTGNASIDADPAFLLSDYDLHLVAKNVPAESVLALARHARPNLAENLNADGTGEADVRVIRSHGDAIHMEGGGQFEALRLTSANTSNEIALGTVPFLIASPETAANVSYRSRAKKLAVGEQKLRSDDSAEQIAIKIGPVNIATGKNNNLELAAQVSRAGYHASLSGIAGVRRLLQSAQVLGISAPPMNADGNSSLDLNIAGTWNGEPSKIFGTAQLRSVFAQIRGANAPLQISKADLILGEDSIKVQNLTASAADAIWRGSLRIPRPCVAPSDCEFQVNLHTAELHSASLNRFFNPALRKRSWYKFLSLSDNRPNYLLQARAKGKIAIDRLQLGNTACSDFSGDMVLNQGRLNLSDLHGEILGGEISGDWDADFSSKPPVYRGTGKLEDISLSDISELMDNQWIDGTSTASYQLSAKGWTFGELLDSAELNADFSMTKGSFPRVVLTKSGILQVERFSGSAQLHQSTLVLQDAKLDSKDALYTVTGTASLDGTLNFKLSGTGTAGFVVSGDIRDTRVSANPTTAASLKP